MPGVAKRLVLGLSAMAVAAAWPAGIAARDPACDVAHLYPLTAPAEAYYVVAKHGLRAYRAPNSEPVAGFGRLNVNGARTVFGVLGTRVGPDCRPTWFRVQLPMRPNGATGFVRASSVTAGIVRTSVSVDLSDHELTLFRGGRPILRTSAGVGSPATPTPVGRYYVNQRLVPAESDGPFGPGAIGISAFSEILTGWAQGGPIAIHGTNQPWSIGRSVSNGCIRVANDVLRRLWTSILPGTPVSIRP